jgi:hypothetical protein
MRWCVESDIIGCDEVVRKEQGWEEVEDAYDDEDNVVVAVAVVANRGRCESRER